MRQTGWRCRGRSGAGEGVVSIRCCLGAAVLALVGSAAAQQAPVDPCSGVRLQCVNGRWLDTATLDGYIRTAVAYYNRFINPGSNPVSRAVLRVEFSATCTSLQNVDVCMDANELRCFARPGSVFQMCAKTLSIRFRGYDVVPGTNSTRMSFLLNNFSLPRSTHLETFRLHNEGSSDGEDDTDDIEDLLNDLATITAAKAFKLSLSGFSLPELDLDKLQMLPAVTDLSLPNNSISFINSTVNKRYSAWGVAPNKKLKNIDLSGNVLTSIPDTLFFPLPNLETLELSKNQLSSFSPALLSRAVHSTDSAGVNIYLNGNNLTWMNTHPLFDRSAYGGENSKAPVLHLHDNPWNCTCYLWSVRYLLKLQHPGERRVTCANLNNRPLLDVIYEELCPSGISVWAANITTPGDAGRMAGRPYLVRNDKMLLACPSDSLVLAHLLCYSAGFAAYQPENYTLIGLSLLSPVLYQHIEYLQLRKCDDRSASLQQCEETLESDCGTQGAAYLKCTSASAAGPPAVYPQSVGDENNTGLIHWQPLRTAEWQSPPGGYVVMYRDAHDANASSFAVQVLASASSLRLPHALPGRSYTVAIKPRTGVVDQYYDLDTFRPLAWRPQAPVPPRITSFNVDTSNFLTVSWASLSDAEWNGLPGDYRAKLCLVNGSHCSELNHTTVHQAPLTTVFDLNGLTGNSSDHRHFRVGVRAKSFDATRTLHGKSHTNYEDVWSKPYAPVANLSAQSAPRGIVLAWTYPLVRDDPALYFLVETCTSSACTSEQLNTSSRSSSNSNSSNSNSSNSAPTTYTIHGDTTGLFAVRNVSVWPCTGAGLSLCGAPSTYSWRRQSTSPNVLEDDGVSPTTVNGTYQYQWTLDVSGVMDNSSGGVLAINIEYTPLTSASPLPAVPEQQSRMLSENTTAVLSTRSGELHFGTKHRLSYVVFSADPGVEAAAPKGDGVSRSTRQLSPQAPADWSVDDSGADAVRLRLPAIADPAEFYQIVSMPIRGSGVPLRQNVTAAGRARRAASGNATSAAPPGGVSAVVKNLALGVTYEIWAQRCVALDAALGVTCGAFSEKKWVATGTQQPTTPTTGASSSTPTTGGGTGPVPGVPGGSNSSLSVTSVIAIAAGVSLSALILALIVVLIALCKARRWRLESKRGEFSPTPPDYTSILIQPYGQNKADNTNSLDPNIMLISEDELALTEMLGRGEFGNVHKGKYKSKKTGRAEVVAAKVLKDVASDGDGVALMEEIVLMSCIAEKGHHENVIRLVVGGRFRGRPCMVMEYMDLGDLHSYLERHRLSSDHKLANHAVLCTNLTSRDLLLLAIQVARGMEYLSVEVQVVHRDLAARNVLIQSAGGDQLNLKIADFGLARSIYKRQHYKRSKGTRVPLKWLAIESLREDLYSFASDVWSFGILMWEIVTLGGHPYPGIPFDRLCHFLESGYRMPRPRYCSRELYSMMRRCWESEPTLRPSFTELADQLDILLSTNAGYITVDPNLNAVECDIVDEVSDSDSDADSPAQHWPTDLFGEMTPGFAMTPDGYLRPRDASAPNQFSFDAEAVAQVSSDAGPRESNGHCGGGDVEPGLDGPPGSTTGSRRGSRKGLTARRQSSVKSGHRGSMVQSILPSLQRMFTTAGSMFRASSTESLDRGLANKTQQQQQQQASTASDGRPATAAPAPPSAAASRGSRFSRRLQRRHSSSDVPSDDSSAATLSDFHRRSSSEGHPEAVNVGENGGQPPSGGAVSRSASNASGKPAVVSRMRWPAKLTEQRQSVEYAMNAPPVPGTKLPPPQLPAKSSPQPPAAAKPELPPKPPRLVIKSPAVSSSSSPQVARRQPAAAAAAQPTYLQPSPFASSESMSKLSGSRESMGDVFDSNSKAESAESAPFAAAPLVQSYTGGTGGSAALASQLPSSLV